jgi:hypothetical protein
VFSGDHGDLYRSDDGGESWSTIGGGLPSDGEDLKVVPRDRRTLYATAGGAIFVSHDAGETFAPLKSTLSFGWINMLSVDPERPATLFVCTYQRSDAFVAKINASGGSLDYSTYLGGSAEERATGIAVDDFGRAIVIGTTDSDDFPAVAPLQSRRDSDGFVSVLDGGGSVLLFSTWVGGELADSVVSVARSGSVIWFSGGTHDLAGLFPGSGANGDGGFVAQLKE